MSDQLASRETQEIDMDLIFRPNIELDALCVVAAMRGGVTAMLGVALRSGCPTPDAALARAKWLPMQPVEYKSKVVARVDELLLANAEFSGASAATPG